ncbi:MAG: choice-of-anchor I family protein [Phycisphaeraceae bacterium]
MRQLPASISTRALLASAAILASGQAAAAPSLTLIGNTPAPSGVAEINAYDSANNQLFTTHAAGLDVYDFGVGSDIVGTSTIDMTAVFGAPEGGLDGISSVAIDPLGRGFGVATAIPGNNITTVGKAVVFNTATGAILNTLDVGFHPDMVTFTPGGDVLIANEGERDTDPLQPLGDAPGSVSRIDFAGQSLATLPAMTGASVLTVDFSASNLTGGASLAGIRVAPDRALTPELDLEPEYITITGDKAYVTLQENSAVGVFDLVTNKWTDIQNIDGKVQTVDASDRDTGIGIDDSVFGLFMPDAIASYSVGGTTYYVTANEGDARDGSAGEEARVKDLALSDFDAATVAALNGVYGDFQADDALGRLNITTHDGNTDADPQIERLTMYGTRSFSIFNGDTGALVYDSGSDFETLTAAALPDAFNSDDSNEDNFDGRSDNKGPEPEGVAVTTFQGTTLAAIGLERIGGIMLYDITDPNNPAFLQYLNTATFTDVEDALGTSVGPEGLSFIEVGGETFLVVSYEDSGEIDVFSVVPEPGSLALLGLGGLLVARRRRGV